MCCCGCGLGGRVGRWEIQCGGGSLDADACAVAAGRTPCRGPQGKATWSSGQGCAAAGVLARLQAVARRTGSGVGVRGLLPS